MNVKSSESGNVRSKPFYSYQQFVAAQCKWNPCLQNLSDFLAGSRFHQKPSRIACLEFSSEEYHPRHQPLDLSSLATILQDPYAKSGSLLGRILIVEDLTKDVIEMIGSSLEVDPLFFAAFLHNARVELTTRKSAVSILPSKARDLDFVTIKYLRALDFGMTSSPGKLLSDANVRRKVSIRPLNGACVGSVQGHFSTLARVNKGEVWLGLVILDPPLGTTFFADERGKEGERIPFILEPRLFQGGFENFLSPPTYSSIHQTTGPGRLSVFDDLIYFWKKERPPVFNPANPTLASLSYYPLKIVAAEWMSFTNLMSYSVEHYECSIEDHTISVTELTKLESYSRHLQSWRRCSVTSASIVRSLASFVKSGSIDLPGPEIWTSLVHDYEYIAATIDSYGRRLEAMTPVITSFIMIVESRRSFLETMNVSRLSYLALIFVPLTFVSSLFSMSEDTAPGSEGFWVYFAVAIPLLALVFLIAGPHNGGIMWITNYLRGRRGRNRDVEIGYCGGEKPKETVHRLVDENL